MLYAQNGLERESMSNRAPEASVNEHAHGNGRNEVTRDRKTNPRAKNLKLCRKAKKIAVIRHMSGPGIVRDRIISNPCASSLLTSISSLLCNQAGSAKQRTLHPENCGRSRCAAFRQLQLSKSKAKQQHPQITLQAWRGGRQSSEPAPKDPSVECMVQLEKSWCGH